MFDQALLQKDLEEWQQGGGGKQPHRWIFCDNDKLRRLITAEVEKTIGYYMKLVINSTQELYIEHRTNITLMLDKVNRALGEVDDTKEAMVECNKAMNEMIGNMLDYKRMDRYIQKPEVLTRIRNSAMKNTKIGSPTTAKRESTSLKKQRGGEDTGPARSTKATLSTINLFNLYGKKAQRIAPVLSFVSIMSTNSFGFGTHIAAVPNDLLIFKIAASIPIHAPRIKLWPTKSDAVLHRFKPDCMDIEGTHYLWIATCKLHKDAPTGRVSFVIQFDSITNVPGVSTKQTTDSSRVKIVKAVALPKIENSRFEMVRKKRKKIKQMSKHFVQRNQQRNSNHKNVRFSKQKKRDSKYSSHHKLQRKAKGILKRLDPDTLV